MAHQNRNCVQEHTLVCLSASPSNAKIIQTAARMASAFGGNFTALYVQTPAFEKMEEADRNRLEQNIRLAKQLGADTTTIFGEDVSQQIAEFARISGVTKIVIGRSNTGRRHFWAKPTLTEKLIEIAPNLDIHIIPDGTVRAPYRAPTSNVLKSLIPHPRDLLITLLLLVAATLVGLSFYSFGFTEANIITVYILCVLLTSLFTKGYACSAISAVMGVVLFNYFHTEPRFTLHAYGAGYPVTFGVMLIASIITGTLASKLKDHAKISAQAAYRTKVLFDTNQLLQKAKDDSDILHITASQLVKLLDRDVWSILNSMANWRRAISFPHLTSSRSSSRHVKQKPPHGSIATAIEAALPPACSAMQNACTWPSASTARSMAWWASICRESRWMTLKTACCSPYWANARWPSTTAATPKRRSWPQFWPRTNSSAPTCFVPFLTTCAPR